MNKEGYINPRREAFVYGDEFPYKIARDMYVALPPSNPLETLPDYWRYESPEKFLEKFKNLGNVVWSRRNAYHALIVSGQHVLRLWTTNKTARLQVNKVLFDALTGKIYGLHQHPSGEFYGVVAIETPEEADLVMQMVREVYGLRRN